MQWLKVILAGLIEVIWVIGLNNAHNFVTVIYISFIALSFYLMISASKQLPVGTVYAVFVGIGVLVQLLQICFSLENHLQ